MMTTNRTKAFVDRVIDSDTLMVWLEVTPDVRVRYRARLVRIEGGEHDTQEGRAGEAIIAEEVAKLTLEQAYWLGSVNTVDKYGRLVGDIITEGGELFTNRLMARGHHWVRNPRSRKKAK